MNIENDCQNLMTSSYFYFAMFCFTAIILRLNSFYSHVLYVFLLIILKIIFACSLSILLISGLNASLNHEMFFFMCIFFFCFMINFLLLLFSLLLFRYYPEFPHHLCESVRSGSVRHPIHLPPLLYHLVLCGSDRSFAL